jgi:hypothetical protein
MELDHLVQALQAGAVVQVGRMAKADLAEALRAQGLDGQADAVATGAGSEFAADGIVWQADRVEAVQHKRTTSRRPLAERKHTTGEINTEGEFARQLRDAANQLSGLTAAGGRRRGARFGSTLPEVPPPGLGRVRVANLALTEIRLPSVEALADYTAVVADVLTEQPGTASGHLSDHVELVRLNFQGGRVDYTVQPGGGYRGRRYPDQGTAQDLPSQD